MIRISIKELVIRTNESLLHSLLCMQLSHNIASGYTDITLVSSEKVVSAACQEKKNLTETFSNPKTLW